LSGYNHVEIFDALPVYHYVQQAEIRKKENNNGMTHKTPALSL